VEPIPVPAPPKSSFNKNRRVSDLLLSQLKHFQHVAHKQGMQIDPALEHDLATEAGAARYIARVTQEMLAQAKPSGLTLVPSAAPAPQPGVVRELAAAPQSSATPRSRPAPKKPNKGKKARS
jgi:hypothetical protein